MKPKSLEHRPGPLLTAVAGLRGSVFSALIIIIGYHLPACSSMAYADGGTFRGTQSIGGFKISVFTSPAPLRAGPIDVSVLVQEQTSGKPRMDLAVVVLLQSMHDSAAGLTAEASTDLATNQILKAAHFDICAAGTWRIEVQLPGVSSGESAVFDVVIAEPPPRWWDLFFWFVWPTGVIAIFIIWKISHRPRITFAAPGSGGTP